VLEAQMDALRIRENAIIRLRETQAPGETGETNNALLPLIAAAQNRYAEYVDGNGTLDDVVQALRTIHQMERERDRQRDVAPGNRVLTNDTLEMMYDMALDRQKMAAVQAAKAARTVSGTIDDELKKTQFQARLDDELKKTQVEARADRKRKAENTTRLREAQEGWKAYTQVYRDTFASDRDAIRNDPNLSDAARLIQLDALRRTARQAWFDRYEAEMTTGIEEAEEDMRQASDALRSAEEAAAAAAPPQAEAGLQQALDERAAVGFVNAQRGEAGPSGLPTLADRAERMGRGALDAARVVGRGAGLVAGGAGAVGAVGLLGLGAGAYGAVQLARAVYNASAALYEQRRAELDYQRLQIDGGIDSNLIERAAQGAAADLDNAVVAYREAGRALDEAREDGAVAAVEQRYPVATQGPRAVAELPRGDHRLAGPVMATRVRHGNRPTDNSQEQIARGGAQRLYAVRIQGAEAALEGAAERLREAQATSASVREIAARTDSFDRANKNLRNTKAKPWVDRSGR
jgi:hypothetical protein